jgi:uncharacterized protein (DUF3820 family)
MESEKLPIIPFGKYKGQLITNLLNDKGYLDWLKKQTFLKEKYTNIYNIIVHQTISQNETSKTPEHNKIQNLFLEKENQYKFLSIFNEELNELMKLKESIFWEKYLQIEKLNGNIIDINTTYYNNKIIFEDIYNWDVGLYPDKIITKISLELNSLNFTYEDIENINKFRSIIFSKPYESRKIEKIADKIMEELFEEYKDKEKLKEDFIKKFDQISSYFYTKDKDDLLNLLEIFNKDALDFYCMGDEYHYLLKDIKNIGKKFILTFEKEIWFGMKKYFCELKPLLGDDYPNVLRKMKNQINLTKKDKSLYNAKFILLIDKFESEVTSKKQLIEIFEQSNIKVILIDKFESEVTSKKQLIEIFEQSNIKVIFIDEIFNNLTLEKKAEKKDIDELKRKLLSNKCI